MRCVLAYNARMDTLKRCFLEEPVYIYTALVVLELILFSLWFSTRSKMRKWLLLAPVLVGVLVFTLDWMVVTDREEIEGILTDIATSIHNGNVEQHQRVVADNYRGFWKTKPALLRAAKNESRTERIESVSVSFKSVKVTGRRAEMKLKTNVRLETGQIVPLRWTIYWGKSDGGWQITEIEAPNFGL